MSLSDQFSVAYRRLGPEVVAEVRGEIDCGSAPVLAHGLTDLIEEQGKLVVVVDLASVRSSTRADCPS